MDRSDIKKEAKALRSQGKAWQEIAKTLEQKGFKSNLTKKPLQWQGVRNLVLGHSSKRNVTALASGKQRLNPLRAASELKTPNNMSDEILIDTVLKLVKPLTTKGALRLHNLLLQEWLK